MIESACVGDRRAGVSEECKLSDSFLDSLFLEYPLKGAGLGIISLKLYTVQVCCSYSYRTDANGNLLFLQSPPLTDFYYLKTCQQSTDIEQKRIVRDPLLREIEQ